MRYQQIIYIFLLSSMFVFTGCQSLSQKPQIPENTVGSFNFTKENGNKRGLEIFDVNGKKVKPSDKEIPKDAKPAGSITIEFFSGSCTARICRPGRPCETVVIDPVNDCPQ